MGGRKDILWDFEDEKVGGNASTFAKAMVDELEDREAAGGKGCDEAAGEGRFMQDYTLFKFAGNVPHG